MSRRDDIADIYRQAMDAAYRFQDAMIAHGEGSYQAMEAHNQYRMLMKDYYHRASDRPSPNHWEDFCTQDPSAVECRLYDL
jgi:hypothetical protein